MIFTTQEDIEKFFELNLENLRSIADEVKYLGFNPVTFIKHLNEIEADPDALASDMSFLLTLYIVRGTTLHKMQIKMSAEGIKRIEILKKKYGIISKVPVDDKEVTLARISSAFPLFCANIIARGFGRNVGDVPSGLPNWLAFPAGASLIPKKDKKLFDKWREWRMNFTRVIQSKDVTGFNEERQVEFDRIIWESPLYNEVERIEIMKKLMK